MIRIEIQVDGKTQQIFETAYMSLSDALLYLSNVAYETECENFLEQFPGIQKIERDI